MSNGIAQLLKIELSSGTVFLSDGGFVVFGGDTYTASSSVLGSIAGIDAFEAGFGGSISQIDVEFNSPSPSAVAALSEAALRNRRIEMYVAEYNPASGAIIGTPERKFVGQIDQSTRRLVTKTVGVSCTSRAEPVFTKNTGNAMSHEFQQLISPGDTGHAQGTGLGRQWAWGTASVGGTTGGSGSFGGGGTPGVDPSVRPDFL